MSDTLPNQSFAIAHAKEQLREHLEDEMREVVDAGLIRTLAFAYLDPKVVEPISEQISDISAQSRSNGLQVIGFLKSVRHAANIQLDYHFGRPSSVYVSHVSIGEWQPTMLPTVAHLDYDIEDNHSVLPNSESLLLEYEYRRKTSFAVLSDDYDARASSRVRVAEHLLELPDNPIYLDLNSA